MKLQVCFNENGKGSWLDFEPAQPLPNTETPDDVMAVLVTVGLPDGMSGLRVVTTTEIWTFQHLQGYGYVPRLENQHGDIIEVWPTVADVGGIWEVQHVLPDGHLLPMMYVPPTDKVPGGFMAKTPTTVAQWNWFARATGAPEKPHAVDTGKGVVNVSMHPVTEVNYWDAVGFATWAGVSLPTEAQWEHAATSGDGRKFPWGNEPPTKERCHCSVVEPQTGTDGVLNRPLGASPYGCLDMAGNVWEWTSTVHK